MKHEGWVLETWNLEAFNMALLSKQVQRQITKPNLLMSKVLRSKYFPKVDIFQVPTRPRDLWLWKSQNETKNLIKDGSTQKVENGGSIRIWEENQLVGDQWKKPFSSKLDDCTVQKVKDLLNQKGEGWNEELIKGIFSKGEAQEILRIPVSSIGVTGDLCGIQQQMANIQFLLDISLQNSGNNK